MIRRLINWFRAKVAWWRLSPAQRYNLKLMRGEVPRDIFKVQLKWQSKPMSKGWYTPLSTQHYGHTLGIDTSICKEQQDG